MPDKGLKLQIISLFHEGKTYNEIKKILGCSKGTISHHCSKFIPIDQRYTKEKIKKYQRYYDTYGGNLGKTATFFNLPKNTLREKLILKPKEKLTKQQRADRNKKLVCDYRRKKKIMAVEYKGGKCQNCGYKKSVYCLDFHHINPKEKDFTISSVTRKWENIVKELKKCVMVCRNCHGEIHEEMQLNGFSKTLNKIIEKEKVQVAELV